MLPEDHHHHVSHLNKYGVSLIRLGRYEDAERVLTDAQNWFAEFEESGR